MLAHELASFISARASEEANRLHSEGLPIRAAIERTVIDFRNLQVLEERLLSARRAIEERLVSAGVPADERVALLTEMESAQHAYLNLFLQLEREHA